MPAATLPAEPALAGPDFLLDLRDVPAVGAADLAALVGLHRRARAAGGRLTLLNVRPAVSDLLALTRLDRLVAVRPAA